MGGIGMDKNSRFRAYIGKFTGLHNSSGAPDELKPGESPRMVNLKITDGYKLKKRAGYTAVMRTDTPVAGMWSGNIAGEAETVFVSDSGLFKLSGDDTVRVGDISHGTKVSFLPFGRRLYILTGEAIYVYDGDTVAPIEPYYPLIAVSSDPQTGSGTLYEDMNILTNIVRQSFNTEGDTVEFTPMFKNCIELLGAKVNGTELSDGQYSFINGGKFALKEAPGAGTDTVEFTYRLREKADPSKILGCRYAMCFGGDNDTRVFLWGNEEYPSVRFCSALAEGQPSACYFTESGMTGIGSGEKICDIIRHYDRQLIFTPHSAYYSYIEYKQDGLGRTFASFPVYSLSSGKGNIAPGQAVLIDNAPCTLSEEGLIRWTSTNIRDERNAVCFSGRIHKYLAAEELKQAIVFDRASRGELFVTVGSRCYVYNYRLDLFYYYEDIPAVCWCEDEKGELYFGTDDGRICRVGGMNDDGKAINAVWESDMTALGDTAHLKNAYSLTIGLLPDADAQAEIGWVSDRASSEQYGKRSAQARGIASTLDFTNIGFDRLSFYSVCGAYMSTVRLNARRFGQIKLVLKNDSMDSSMSILSLCLTGEVTSKRV